jgi:hypothetical protein
MPGLRAGPLSRANLISFETRLIGEFRFDYTKDCVIVTVVTNADSPATAMSCLHKLNLGAVTCRRIIASGTIFAVYYR